MWHSRSRERSPLIIEQGSSEAPSVSLSCQKGEAGQMERSLHFVCPAVRCGLTADRYPLSAVRGNGIPERGHRLQTIRLQTLDSIDFTYHSGVPPLVAGATTLPGGKHVTGSPMNPVPLPPPQFGGAAKGKRLNGQARRLTSPLWRSYAGPPQGHYNPCLL